MKGFLSFRHFKRLLKIAGVLWLLTAGGMAWGIEYTWNNSVPSGYWDVKENWIPNTGYPSTSDDIAIFTGEAAISVTVQKETTPAQTQESPPTLSISSIQFNTKSNSLITLDMNGHNIYCWYRVLLDYTSTYHTDSNVKITGAGTLKTDTFDFSSDGIHSFEITDNESILIIEKTLWANSDGTLIFSGNGHLYLPNGGANVNYGPSNIQYEIDTTHRHVYAAGTPTYICSISKNTNDYSITFSKGLPNEGTAQIKFPYKVIITDTDTDNPVSYTLGNTTPPLTLSSGVYTGNFASYSGNSNLTMTGNSSTFTLERSSTPSKAGDGITIIIYSPDGKDPSDSTEANAKKSFMELGRISWYYKKPTWVGPATGSTESNQYWTTKANWTGVDDISDIKDLSAYDIEITTTDPSKTPVINDYVSVKTLTITPGANVTLKSGKISTNKIQTTGIGSKFSSTGGIVELIKNGSSEPSLLYAFDDASTIEIKNLSIGEGATFTMPVDLNLGMLILNSGANFSKGGRNLTLGWLQVQTTNFYGGGNITLTEPFEADSIIFLLRDGNITVNGTLKARKDFIIGGANYKFSNVVKYEHFTTRPDGWVKSFTYTSLDIKEGDPWNQGSSIYLSSGANLIAGSSGQGNFYINGATLIGLDSNKNKIIIPQNDTPANFCAEGIFSTIVNMSVACGDPNNDMTIRDEEGNLAQIPLSGCQTPDCKRNTFDSQEFGIKSAHTLSDNRIYVETDRPVRKIIDPSAIKTSDGSSFTAEYSSTTDNLYSSFYLTAANTTWNTDATGTSTGSGKYGDSKGNFRTVKPYLVIPQYISNEDGSVKYGYLITDKWGKRLQSYSPDSNAFTNVTDGIPEDQKTLRISTEFAGVIGAVGSDKLILTFSKPIVTNSSKLSLMKGGSPVTITETLEDLLPACFQIISISEDGKAEVSESIQIDSSKKAEISLSKSESQFGIVKLHLTRNLTLDDIEKLFVRLIQHPSYTGKYADPIPTETSTEDKCFVTFIQEPNPDNDQKGSFYMQQNTAYTISDFAIGAASPSYAYTSGTSEGGEVLTAVYKNVYGDGGFTVRDFSKNQKNYGTLSYGEEITLVAKFADSSSENISDSRALKLYISDEADSASLFTKFNLNFGATAAVWLPAITSPKIDFTAYSDENNSRFWDFTGTAIKKNKSSAGYSFIIPKDTVKQMKNGSQLSFLYALSDLEGNLIEHYKAPYLTNIENGTYDLSQSTKNPLFIFNLSDAKNLTSFDLWYIRLKSITEQRGGVTILNNVINAAVGEKTVLKVNMPSSGNLDIMIMTLDGNIVKYLAHGNASAGQHYYYWDGRNNSGSEVARGMYFVIIKAPGIDENRKVMVVK